MRYRPSKRVVWLVIPLLPVVVMTVGIWLAGREDTEAIASRGAKPPPERKLSADPSTWPTAFSRSGEWLGDGMDAVMTWDHNPWKRRKDDFGQHFYTLRGSAKPEDKAEYERLKRLGREWYERLLARFPELAIQPGKTVPNERNGSYQWNELLKRLKTEPSGPLFSQKLPEGLETHLRKGGPLDAQAAKEWLDGNRGLIDELRAIGLLPEHSNGDIPAEERINGFISYSQEAMRALLLDARLAADQGDISRALESIRAANGLADHLSETEDPIFLNTLVAGSLRNQVQSYVLSGILPFLPAGQVDVSAWQHAVNPIVRQPTDFARTMRGEWNTGLPTEFLPLLSDAADPSVPSDPDYLIESFTHYTKNLIQQGDTLTLADFANAPRRTENLDHLSRRSRDLAESMGMGGGYDMTNAWILNQSRNGLTLAAFAIMNGQPVPDDPVSGKPYVWDAETRQLSPPDFPRYKTTRIKPITVPKM